MKRFLNKVLWFIVPPLILLSPAYFILSSTKENYFSIDEIIASDKKYIMGYAYNQENYRYLKWKTLIEKDRKKVWALGSSRVLQFRRDMFDESFYNAGYTILSITDFMPFLESIPEDKYPEIMIIGLDQWMFNDNWDDLKRRRNKLYWENSFKYNASLNNFKYIYRDLIEGKIDVSKLTREDDDYFRVGLDASLNSNGFRNDGSIFYSKNIKKLIANDSTVYDYGYQATYDKIKKGHQRFEYGSHINEQFLNELEILLRFCKENKIHVVGFLPPYADEIHSKMKVTGKYSYIKDVFPKAKPYFDAHGYEFWDMSQLKTYNSGDHETIDGFHGGELSYGKMLYYLATNGSKLEQYVDDARLKKDIENKINNYIIYKY